MPSHSQRLTVYPETDPGKRSDAPATGAGLGNPSAAAFAASPATPQTFAGTLGIGGGGQPHENRQPYLAVNFRSAEHTSELQSLMRISYAVFCLKKKNNQE